MIINKFLILIETKLQKNVAISLLDGQIIIIIIIIIINSCD